MSALSWLSLVDALLCGVATLACMHDVNWSALRRGPVSMRVAGYCVVAAFIALTSLFTAGVFIAR